MEKKRGIEEEFLENLAKLRDLEADLNSYADMCEESYIRVTSSEGEASSSKVLESTKGMLRTAFVNTTDHLGKVASSLNVMLDLQALEVTSLNFQVRLIKQRLDTCQALVQQESMPQMPHMSRPTRQKRYTIPDPSVTLAIVRSQTGPALIRETLEPSTHMLRHGGSSESLASPRVWNSPSFKAQLSNLHLPTSLSNPRLNPSPMAMFTSGASESGASPYSRSMHGGATPYGSSSNLYYSPIGSDGTPTSRSPHQTPPLPYGLGRAQTEESPRGMRRSLSSSLRFFSGPLTPAGDKDPHGYSGNSGSVEPSPEKSPPRGKRWFGNFLQKGRSPRASDGDMR